MTETEENLTIFIFKGSFGQGEQLCFNILHRGRTAAAADDADTTIQMQWSGVPKVHGLHLELNSQLTSNIQDGLVIGPGAAVYLYMLVTELQVVPDPGVPDPGVLEYNIPAVGLGEGGLVTGIGLPALRHGKVDAHVAASQVRGWKERKGPPASKNWGGGAGGGGAAGAGASAGAGA